MKRDDQGTDASELPHTGRDPSTIYAELDALQEQDIRWGEGRVAALVFLAGEDVREVARTAYNKYFSTNGLSPRAFKSLDALESDVVAMTCHLLNGDSGATGNITSGGTESIIMGVKSARDQALQERPDITQPEMVVPFTAHPAFNKAGHYLGVRVVRTPLTDDYRVDLAAYEDAVGPNTILMAGSAPNYPHGMVDPIPQMAEIARQRGIRFHVDACVGDSSFRFLNGWDTAFPHSTSASPVSQPSRQICTNSASAPGAHPSS